MSRQIVDFASRKCALGGRARAVSTSVLSRTPFERPTFSTRPPASPSEAPAATRAETGVRGAAVSLSSHTRIHQIPRPFRPQTHRSSRGEAATPAPPRATGATAPAGDRSGPARGCGPCCRTSLRAAGDRRRVSRASRREPLSQKQPRRRGLGGWGGRAPTARKRERRRPSGTGPMSMHATSPPMSLRSSSARLPPMLASSASK